MRRFSWLSVLVLAGTLVATSVSVGAADAIVPGGVAVSLENGSAIAVSSGTFWGVDGHTQCSTCIATQSVVGGFLNASPIRWVRYGELSDGCNDTINTWYKDDGTPLRPCPFNLTALKAWCESTVPSCHTFLTLPGENNNSAEDAAIASWIVHQVGLRPDFWSIGNEPTGWTHYGIPWTKWSLSDRSTPTPLAYAIDVRNAIAAVKKVDPSAQFIGIQAACACDAQWFSAVAKVDGASISAMSYHSYPSPGTVSNETLAQFYAPLLGRTNITNTYATVRSDIVAGCATCGHLPIDIGEYNAGPPTSAPLYDGTYADAVFLAASVTQALRANVTDLAIFDLQSQGTSFDYAMLNAAGRADSAGLLYRSVLGHLALGSVYATRLTPSVPNVWSVETRNSTDTSLLVVNANLTTDVSVALGTAFPTQVPGLTISWNSSTARPVLQTTSALRSTYAVPSQGILLLDTPAPGHLPPGPPPPPSGIVVQTVTDSTVALAWENPPATAVVNDTLYLGLTCGTWSRVVSVGVETGVVATGLRSETSYCFVVTDWTSAGESPASEAVLARTLAPPAGTPANLTVVAVTSSSVSLSWSNPAGGATGNTIYYDTTCGPWYVENIPPTAVANVTGLASNTTYCFAVSATIQDVVGPPSSRVLATTLAAGPPNGTTNPNPVGNNSPGNGFPPGGFRPETIFGLPGLVVVILLATIGGGMAVAAIWLGRSGHPRRNRKPQRLPGFRY